MQINRITFPVGDWSDDGHGKCDYYIVESNKTRDELAAIHNRCEEVLGFKIENIARHYEEPWIDTDILEKMDKAGFDYKSHRHPDDGYEDEDKFYVYSETVITIWVELLMFIDPTAECRVIPDEELPSMNWHVRVPGYGCFN